MRSSKRARSFQRKQRRREDEQGEDGIVRTKGKRSNEWVVNSKRVTRSVSVIVTERRARQSERQEKGSGMRAKLPFLVRFKPELRALAEKSGFEPELRSTRTTPLAGEPLQPLGYFSLLNLVFIFLTLL